MCIELKLCVCNVNLNVYGPGWERHAVAIARHATHDILKKMVCHTAKTLDVVLSTYMQDSFIFYTFN